MSVFQVVAFYLGAYLLMTLLAFLVVGLVRVHRDSEELDAYRGLGKTSPFLALVLLVAMASLAGVPLTAGFFGKFFVFKLVVEQHQWGLLVLVIDLLVELMPNVPDALAPEGRVIVSGFLTTQAKAVHQAARDAGIDLFNFVRRGKWVTAVGRHS